MVTIAIIGTCDTKLEELLYLRSQILSHHGTKVLLIDAGRTPVDDAAITTTQTELLKYSKDTAKVDIQSLPRGDLIKHMITCASACIIKLHHDSQISAIISAGGSGATSLASAVMRNALPIGFPKLIVSTVASGETGPIVGETDITMTYSVVDIAGSNALLEDILANAAGAIVGMAKAYNARLGRTAAVASAKKRVGITMFGVTTPCADKAREILEAQYNAEVYVFHATGHGGRAMERLVREKRLDAVLDISTTEICDWVAGGNMSAGSHRLEAAAVAGIPYVLSAGACDMVNFGARNTVPDKYKDRLLYEHNPTVTLMRTSEDECREVGNFFGKLRWFAARPEKVQVYLPIGGVSMISTPGGPFEDKQADEALFGSIERELHGTDIVVKRDEREINDPSFAGELAHALGRML